MPCVRAVATALLALVVALGGCDRDRTESQKSARPADRGGARTPSACTSAGAEDLISRFLANDESDGEVLVEAFIAPEPDFQWFSTRDRVGMELAADRQSLAAYLTERRRQGARQHLSEFHFNGIDDDHANVSFTMAEGAGEAVVTYPGKAAVHCAPGKLIVWSEGTPSLDVMFVPVREGGTSSGNWRFSPSQIARRDLFLAATNGDDAYGHATDKEDRSHGSDSLEEYGGVRHDDECCDRCHHDDAHAEEE